MTRIVKTLQGENEGAVPVAFVWGRRERRGEGREGGQFTSGWLGCSPHRRTGWIAPVVVHCLDVSMMRRADGPHIRRTPYFFPEFRTEAAPGIWVTARGGRLPERLRYTGRTPRGEFSYALEGVPRALDRFLGNRSG